MAYKKLLKFQSWLSKVWQGSFFGDWVELFIRIVESARGFSTKGVAILDAYFAIQSCSPGSMAI